MSIGNGKLLAALLAFVALAGLWLGACGGGADRDEYAQEVQSALSGLSADLRDLGDQLGSSAKSAELASGLDQARTDLDETAAELEDLDVPDDLVDVNDALVAVIRNFSSELGAVVELAQSGNQQDRQQANADLLGLVARFQAGINAVRQKAAKAGLTIGPTTTTTTTTPTSPSE